MSQLPAAAGTMSSIESLREFISERLRVAAEEIFTVFERTIIQYEEQKEQLQDVTEGPHITFLEEPADNSGLVLCKKEQLWVLEKPEAPQGKEEEGELRSSQLALQLELKQEFDSFLETPADGGSEHREAEAVNIRSDSQHNWLNVIWTPEIKLHKIDIFKENRHCNQGRNSILSQEDLSLLQEEEEQEHWTAAEGQQLLLQQQCVDSVQTSAIDEKDHSRPKSKPTSPKKKPYSCSEYSKSLKWKSDLNRHTINHSGKKPHYSSGSSKTSRRKGNLLAHERSRKAELMNGYSCSHCCKSFLQWSRLKDHERTHTGEKPYSCSVCFKLFSWKGTLNRHKKTHTGDKSYSCSQCYKSFYQKSHLIRHSKTHK